MCNADLICSVLIVLEKLSTVSTNLAAGSIDMEFRKKVYECKNDGFYELIQCIVDKVRHYVSLDCRPKCKAEINQ